MDRPTAAQRIGDRLQRPPLSSQLSGPATHSSSVARSFMDDMVPSGRPHPIITGDAEKSNGDFASESQGNEVTIHGVSVRATRNPMLLLAKSGFVLLREAERSFSGVSSQEPPQTNRDSSLNVLAFPSVGAP